MDAIKSHRSLSRKYLHMLLNEQLMKLNFSYGVGEIYYGLQFLPRCTVIYPYIFCMLSVSSVSHPASDFS
jgi:hypothetical protein